MENFFGIYGGRIVVNLAVKTCFTYSIKNSESSSSLVLKRIFNLLNSNPFPLLKFIEIIEEEIGVKAIKSYKSIQQEDVKANSADISKLQKWIGFRLEISIKERISFFIRWFKNYYLD